MINKDLIIVVGGMTFYFVGHEHIYPD